MAGWTLVSVLLHVAPLCGPRLRRVLERLGEADPFSLLTTWNLFAPHPPLGDFRFLVRYRLRDQSMTRWQEAPITPERTPRHAFWHPDLVAGAVFQRYASAFCEPPPARPDARMLSLPYLALLSYAVHLPQPADARAVQFLLVLTSVRHPEHQPRPLFLSNVHAVKAPGPSPTPGGTVD